MLLSLLVAGLAMLNGQAQVEGVSRVRTMAIDQRIMLALHAGRYRVSAQP